MTELKCIVSVEKLDENLFFLKMIKNEDDDENNNNKDNNNNSINNANKLCLSNEKAANNHFVTIPNTPSFLFEVFHLIL